MLPKLSKFFFKAHEYLLGRQTFPYSQSLEETQWQSREALEALQLQKLQTLLAICLNHSPWHARRIREAGVDPDDLTWEDFRRLPTMNKNDARIHGADMVWHNVPGGAHPYSTGGSTGQPLKFHFGRWRQASDAAGRMRARRWWGIEPGDPEVYLWGAPVELKKTDVIKTIRDRLINQLVLNAFSMSPDTMRNYLETIRKFKPKSLYGYASSVALLATFALDNGGPIQLPSLKVICTTGEPLYPHQRSVIQEAFGVPVANEFGSRDIGFTAHESPSGQMLLMSESIILEVLDEKGDPAPAGESGEAVMTQLHSEAQPFIRYRTGDIVKLSKEEDKEGRGLHIIETVLGRSTDFLVHQDGSIVHALAAIYILREISGIEQFRIIQERTDRFEILLVTNSKWKKERNNQSIIHGFQKRFGINTRINIKILDSIPPDPSGKNRQVISLVAPEQS